MNKQEAAEDAHRFIEDALAKKAEGENSLFFIIQAYYAHKPRASFVNELEKSLILQLRSSQKEKSD